MFALFFTITALAESVAYAWVQFIRMWYWIVLLAAGFGIQIALHVHIREQLRQRQAQAAAGVAASGGVSTFAMLACCAHRVTDVLPFLGASAAAVFLVQYQTPFLVLGVFSNLLGILFMFRIMQKHGLGPAQGPVKALLTLDLKRALVAMAVIGLVAVGWSFNVIDAGAGGQAVAADTIRPLDLPAQENTANGLTVKAEPIKLTLGKPVRFSIVLDTHAGSLDADLAQAATLIDDRGTVHAATAWDGPPPGGHHASGTLSFPTLDLETKSFRLVLKGIYDVPERILEWQIP
jgi:hypothetical protein